MPSEDDLEAFIGERPASLVVEVDGLRRDARDIDAVNLDTTGLRGQHDIAGIGRSAGGRSRL